MPISWQHRRILSRKPSSSLFAALALGASIGLLLCKSKNKVVAEYALNDKSQPMGIAEYKLQEALPAELETDLPSIEQIERELQPGNTD